MLTQTLSQGYSLVQSNTLRLELSQALALTVGLTRPSGSPGNPEDILRRILQMITRMIKNDHIRPMIEKLTTEELFVKQLFASRSALAVLSPERVSRFVVDYLYACSTLDGRFVHMTDSAGQPVVDPPSASLEVFARAMLSEKQFQVEIDAYARLARGVNTRLRSSHEYTGLLSAQKVASCLRPLFENLCTILRLVFAQKAGGEITLAQFLLDTVILEKLDLIMSERLSKRFLKRFGRVGPRAHAQDFVVAMLNTIAEYTLMSMGVISPEIFTLQRGRVDSEAYDSARTELAGIGIKLDKVLAHYNLTGSGSYFWCRYSTTKGTPTDRSEKIVRRFVTETVRESESAILSALSWGELFEQIKSANAEDDPDEAVLKILTNRLGSEEFQAGYMLLLRSWYPKLETLL